jgi:hypothetical protein
MEQPVPSSTAAEQAAAGWGVARPRSINTSNDGLATVVSRPSGWNRVSRPSVDAEDPTKGPDSPTSVEGAPAPHPNREIERDFMKLKLNCVLCVAGGLRGEMSRLLLVTADDTIRAAGRTVSRRDDPVPAAGTRAVCCPVREISRRWSCVT